MARKKYIKSHSNYSIKSVHQQSSLGKIFERDYMTVSEMNTFIKGGLPVYDLSHFKMVAKNGINFKKKYRKNDWVTHSGCGIEDEYWSEECMGTDFTNHKTNDFKLKSNYKSLLDFACYGSAYEMVYSTVNKILTYFPAEVILTEEKININGKIYYKVDNDFQIDFDTLIIDESKPVDNPLRIFSMSYNNYYISGAVGVNLKLSYNLTKYDDGTDLLADIDLGNGIILHCLKYGGSKILVHDHVYNGVIKIQLKNSIIEDYFSGLDDFEKVMLNRETKYTMILNTPSETENGYIEYELAYQWPLNKYGWNLDISSNAFISYIESIYDIAKFYDMKFTDNMWRSMTHESMINFDWTFKRENANGEENVKLNSGRVKSFIKVAGRQFDDIKRYIDGIRFINNISYNGINNASDNILFEKLYNSGWETKNVVPTFSNYYITKPLYPGHYSGKKADDANKEFLRRLFLNSRYILSSKGTKKGVEMILAMFGFRSVEFIENCYHNINRGGVEMTLKFSELTESEKEEVLSNSYDMNEFVYVAGEGSTAYEPESVEAVKSINKSKNGYMDGYYPSGDELQGLPVKEVVSYDTETEEIKNYLIPWFDKGSDYDGKQYFEGKGGWGLSNMEKITTSFGYGIDIHLSKNVKLYDETVNYLRFVNSINELTDLSNDGSRKNSVYYVYDLSDYEKYDFGKEERLYDNMTHYFILKNEDKFDVVGLDSDGEYGWRNISKSELENTVKGTDKSEDAMILMYVDSIKDVNSGNNPHCGYGMYDNGDDYISNFKNIFAGAIKENWFDNVSDVKLPWMNEDGSINENGYIGFNLEKQVDNVKCWFFTDMAENRYLKELTDTDDGYIIKNDVKTPDVGNGNYFRMSKLKDVNMGTLPESYIDEVLGTSHLNTIKPYNMEDGVSYSDESAANSIINTKQFSIKFKHDKKSPMSLYGFIRDTVLFYVKQMVPSTTIFKYNIPDYGIDSLCGTRTYLESVTE